jgi:glycerol-3-phosphate dehydrogenase
MVMLGGGLGVAAGVALAANASSIANRFDRSDDADLSPLGIAYPPKPNWVPPSRGELWTELSKDEPYDLLVIGGGATGTGVAVDAASRGLRVALVEREDFGAGTSSRSTKLVHGGVRYLENAFKKLDYSQYLLVKEALHERFTYLRNAAHLTSALPIMLPMYSWWTVPYYWAGTHVYDLVSGSERLASSYYVSKQRALELFPMLNPTKLCGAMVFFDGQTNDSRMNIALAMTAIALGATALNHTEAVSFVKDDQGRITGGVVRDLQTDTQVTVRAKAVINATGPFCDHIRRLDDPEAENVIVPSSGTHIVLPDYYSPEKMGLLDPATSDGRVIFFVPWEGSTVAGTTDVPCKVEPLPKPSEHEIAFILGEIKSYLSPDVRVRRGDVRAAWTGIRPLVKDPSVKGTSQLSRSHVVLRSESGLISIAGGKWTTYRAMAEHVVDEALRSVPDMVARGKCVTEKLQVFGSHDWSPNLHIKAVQSYGLDSAVATHLAENFGDRLHDVVKLCRPTGKRWPVLGIPIAPGFPYTEAEVRYVVRHEYACTLTDTLARRLRLGFLDTLAALEIADRVADVMAEELRWDAAKRELELRQFRKYLRTMGSNEAISRSEFNALELVALRTFFDSVDTSSLDQVSFGQLLTKLDTLNIHYDPNVLASAFGQVMQASATSATTIDFAGFLDLLFVARQAPGQQDRNLSQTLLKVGSSANANGGV